MNCLHHWILHAGEKRGVIGVCTDLRQVRRKSLAPQAGLNLFVAGAVMASGLMSNEPMTSIQTIARVA